MAHFRLLELFHRIMKNGSLALCLYTRPWSGFASWDTLYFTLKGAARQFYHHTGPQKRENLDTREEEMQFP